MNKVFLNGFLAQDPKGRVTPKGLDQSNITVAVDDSKNSNETYFIPCVIWGNSAKYVNANLTKGSFVAIDGRLSKRKYVMQNGQVGYVTEVLVDNIKVFNFKRNKTHENEVETKNLVVKEREYPDVTVEIDDVINNSINELDNNIKNNKDHLAEYNEMDWDKEFN